MNNKVKTEDEKNPYKRLPESDDEEYRRQLQERVAQQSHGHYTDEHIDGVTKDFCHWVVNLGGAQDNIDEETVGDLFAIGHESKPTISVPLNVIQLIEVPKEVLNNIGKETTPESGAKGFRKKKQGQKEQKQFRPQETETKELLSRYVPPTKSKLPKRTSSNEEKRIWSIAGPQKETSSKLTKCRYGAWYLKPNTWKKLHPGEVLKSPDSQHVKTMNEARVISSKFDEELAPMHVTKSFMSYVKEKKTRKPAFFNHLEEIQKRLYEEEQIRQQEARNHKQKLLSRLYHAPTQCRENTAVTTIVKVGAR